MKLSLRGLALWLLAGGALAQDAPAPAQAAASAPQRIEITGGRHADEARRRATAAKTVIERDEIDAYGDSTIGEVLRRLPGVTTPGGPGRGGAPRLRGLGGGYTQLLIDGEPIPRGFSLESLTPEQVERIEILRAPTAETGARAIAGTINIVLREGYRKRLNDLRLGLGIEEGRSSPGVFWTHNDSAEALTYNLSGSLFERNNHDESRTRTTLEDDTGQVLEQSQELTESGRRRRGVNATARLQWRLGAQGDQLMLTPSLFHADNGNLDHSTRTQSGGTPSYDRSRTEGASDYTVARLNGQWRQQLTSAVRGELGATGSRWQSSSQSLREEAGAVPRSLQQLADTAENSLQLNGKLSRLWGGDEAVPGSEHSLVTGGELQLLRRSESATLRQDGLLVPGASGDNLQASSTRAALYAQDEWNPTAQWSTHAGLRWEGIATVGDAGELGDGTRPHNRNSVWTPLLHAVWKPDPKSRSQLRVSLTRSWREPSLGNLIARPRPDPTFPLDGPNDATHPDRIGNPDLRPELATGVDVAWEYYPLEGGVFSVSLFARRIRDLMRSVVRLEPDVPWSTAPRWVSRVENIGDATTQGVELEAKGRLDVWRPGAPRVEMRASLSLYDSAVDSVPGPDNRLEEQPGASANLGADWSLRGVPLKLGGNLNWVPGYATQIDARRRAQIGGKQVVDVYALWTFSPSAALRVQAGNLLALDSERVDSVRGAGLLETTSTLEPSAIGWQVRLELKL